MSETATAYLADLKAAPEELFYHALAVLHAPAYRAENAGGLRQDWPRIPLPTVVDAASSRVSRAGGTRLEAASTLLRRSAAVGRQVAALLDPETPVPGVTTGKIRDEFKRVAVFERLDGKSANPDAGDLDLTAGWGHAGKGGVCMPGRGKIVVVNAAAGHSAGVDAASSRVSCAEDMRLEAASTTTAYDVYLNDAACWRNVPEPVWEYTIGGYQVIKKWLSYREKPLLGRSLTPDEVRHVTDTARRLAALIALQPALDANYRAVADAVHGR